MLGRARVSDSVEYLFPASLGPVFARRTFPFLFATRARNFTVQRCGPHFPTTSDKRFRPPRKQQPRRRDGGVRRRRKTRGGGGGRGRVSVLFREREPTGGRRRGVIEMHGFRKIFATFSRPPVSPTPVGIIPEFPCILFGYPTDGRTVLSPPFAPSMEMGTRETLSRDHSIHFPGSRDDPA